MRSPDDYLKEAEDTEVRAAQLPEGFEKSELLRKVAAWREIALILAEQECASKG